MHVQDGSATNVCIRLLLLVPSVLFFTPNEKARPKKKLLNHALSMGRSGVDAMHPINGHTIAVNTEATP